ncbi:U3 small nucleolar RNA-associated protein 6 [Zymoseptoria brevis]|uniref:U3 small nucleolar RNA-associated protein 6 n=1 Tax=Zymoseptoria brevis TaxID=1047168 RepID=A0A0F4G4W7_9PEZI|nr:U3 small nucleolar RNA-associated protein 6 [Zymoseptoria brevis]
MAATTDRARFYLEQYVPELQEYERKQIFTRDEISAITAKRSDFEHVLNARGSQPGDYARYATYEMNLDSLRRKRCRRLGVKATAFNGQRTVFFILDRATKKFPGDMGLWMQYINFCKKEKANKKLAKVFTAVLRLHPRDWSLWVLAAKHYAETQGDMGTARSYMQRGLRFCKDEKKLYLEYAKLELVYLAKLAARRKILGLDGSREEKEDMEEDDNMIALPTITAEDIDPDAGKGIEEIDEVALQRLAAAPAFSGAIPIAIFDSAMKQLKKNALPAAEDFFDLVASFNQVPAVETILQHILEHLQSTAPTAFETTICEAKHHMLNIPLQSADFPPALGKGLARLKAGVDGASERLRPKTAVKAAAALLSWAEMATKDLAEDEALDDDLVTVVEATIKRYRRLGGKKGPEQDTVPAIMARLRGEGDGDGAMLMVDE